MLGLRQPQLLLILWSMIFGGISLKVLASETQPSVFQAEQPQQALTIMSWNLAWFGARQQPRTSADHQYIAGVIREISPDIIAFQEIDHAGALQQILPDHQYQIFLSDRRKRRQESFKDGNQYTGFAIKRTLKVTDPQDLASLNIRYAPATGKKPLRGRLRYGTYVIVYPESGPPLHLLNVHLKSGCYTGSSGKQSAACRVLDYQADVLHDWISQRLARHESFLIGGDFNHRMAESGSWFYTLLTEQTGSKYSVRLLTKDVKASCYVRLKRRGKKPEYRHYTRLIDHFVASADIAAAAKQGQVYQFSFPRQDVRRYTLSDHCPVVLRLPSASTRIQ